MTKKIKKYEVGDILFYFYTACHKMTLNKCRVVKTERAIEEDKRFKLLKYYLEDLESKESFLYDEGCNYDAYIFSKKEEALELFKKYVVAGVFRYKDLLDKFPNDSKREEWKSNLLYTENLLETLRSKQ